MLQFDKVGLTNEILDKLRVQLEYAFTAWRTEVLNKLSHPYFGTNMNPYVEYELKKQSNIIVGFLEVNTYVLADSYGTGSLMLTDNPDFEEYKKANWSQDGIQFRTSTTIVGRPAGTYTDVFGRPHTTSGVFKGKPIEGKTVFDKDGKKYKIQPHAPSKAIQMANQWLYKTYLPNAYRLAIQEINFGKFLIES